MVYIYKVLRAILKVLKQQPFTRTIHGNVEYDMLRRNRYNINTLLVTNPLMPL